VRERNIPWKMLVGMTVILAALLFLIIPSLQSGAQYYLMIDELLSERERYQSEVVRISGAVIGESIEWDAETDELRFLLANVPADLDVIEVEGGFQASLHLAVTDPERTRLLVVASGAPPELLQDEAQAIVTGRLGEEGAFYADDILLKCPSRYQAERPEESADDGDGWSGEVD